MSRCCSLGLCAPNTLSLSSSPRSVKAPLCITSHTKPISNADSHLHIDHPALAITGVNHEQELSSVVLDIGIISVWYFLVMPPIIMNWLRVRWYRRKFLEMYLQFMCVFMFFPGLLLWAPFLNFRKFPRDPSMKYPWDKPKDPSTIKNGYLKYPFAQPEDYDY
ncbi:hypothetical protein F2Q70_00015871 [Brassica cretica]|uniref:Uncharacterized protein n=1 Tax=Brassica cretica TaxID=69181 RepID=A0A3N6PKF6_BRACR|nr:hypothetical protein F2Q70_00015871 [Brassica cretica]KAF3596181.1 hypothetical protein DY000_02020306 [Brassica cretica]